MIAEEYNAFFYTLVSTVSKRFCFTLLLPSSITAAVDYDVQCICSVGLCDVELILCLCRTLMRCSFPLRDKDFLSIKVIVSR